MDSVLLVRIPKKLELDQEVTLLLAGAILGILSKADDSGNGIGAYIEGAFVGSVYAKILMEMVRINPPVFFLRKKDLKKYR